MPSIDKQLFDLYTFEYNTGLKYVNMSWMSEFPEEKSLWEISQLRN